MTKMSRFLYKKNKIYLSLGSMKKVQAMAKPSALKREHPALQLHFLIFTLLDPCGSGSTTLFYTGEDI
jgi:hypothetical protein